MGPWRHGDGCRSPDDTSDAAQPNVATPELGRTHRHGHTPYRRDCAVCQQTMQQCHPHRKVPHPVGGVLSLDVAGPLIPAKHIGGLYARWMLVGTLTWAVPAESEKMKDPEVPKAEGNEPHFEVYPEDEEKMKIMRKKVRRRQQVRRKMEKIQWKFGLKKMR